MPTIPDLIPQADALLALQPEDLAGLLLHCLSSLPERDHHLHLTQFMDHESLNRYPRESHDAILMALAEAWVWLEREGLIAPTPGKGTHGGVFVTRRGKRVADPSDLKAYRHANLLPREVLYGRLAQKVWASFLRGDYDTAVFQAFKEVEVRVREAGNFAPSDIGVPLMRKAFAPGLGPLADKASEQGEQEALANLFAGAVGSYKNPSSHRNVTIEAIEAVEIIMLASHLLNIVERL